MTSSEIITKLKSLSNPSNIEGMKRFAAGGANTLGISMPALRKMAKEINREFDIIARKSPRRPTPALPKSGKQSNIDMDCHAEFAPTTSGLTMIEKHKLALELWESGIHEARILACMIDEPSLVTEKQMDAWIADFDSWDICDQVCMNLFDKTEFSFDKAIKWSSHKNEFEKRAGFALMAVLAWHQKNNNLPDEKFLQFLPIIVREATDERNFVKKAVNWALRQIGKSRPSLRQPAIDCAKEILKIYPGNRGAKWIANDAIRELS